MRRVSVAGLILCLLLFVSACGTDSSAVVEAGPISIGESGACSSSSKALSEQVVAVEFDCVLKPNTEFLTLRLTEGDDPVPDQMKAVSAAGWRVQRGGPTGPEPDFVKCRLRRFDGTSQLDCPLTTTPTDQGVASARIKVTVGSVWRVPAIDPCDINPTLDVYRPLRVANLALGVNTAVGVMDGCT